MMNSSLFFVLLPCLLGSLHITTAEDVNVPFEQNYVTSWGVENIKLFNQSREVQLTLNQYSGSGFWSLQKYASGWFSMRIKWPQKDTTGVITTFYFMSDDSDTVNYATRDEIDFELLGGNNKEQKYILHTNIFTNGQGDRQQGFFLWFDPTKDFHNYTILWNEKQLVFFVDEIPVRVFKNTIADGGSYPTKGMNIMASIWNASWATNGGTINWNDAPFEAHYSGFGINGCQSGQECKSSQFWWNANNYWDLNSRQKEALKNVRMNYLDYDYCASSPHIPECIGEFWGRSEGVHKKIYYQIYWFTILLIFLGL